MKTIKADEFTGNSQSGTMSYTIGSKEYELTYSHAV